MNKQSEQQASGSPPLPLRERNKLRVREELKNAALDLYVEDDPQALNVENIARRAGCSKATVYVYFPGGRDDILRELYSDISSEVNNEGLARYNRAVTAYDRIMALAEALLELSTRPRRGKFFAQLNPEISPTLKPVTGQSSGRYLEMLETALATVTDENVEAMAVLLVGALREAAIKVAQNPDRQQELMAAFSALAAYLLAGLKAQNTE